MPKINQEEYEILKGSLSDAYKWIARDSDNSISVHRHKPVKQNHWIQLYRGNGGNGYKEIDGSLLQFIQWEDEEPHNIQELIEEYEEGLNLKEQMSVAMDRLEEVCGIAMKEVGRVFGGSGLESEETEVKKDIEWLKEKIEREVNRTFGEDEHVYSRGQHKAYTEVLNLISQLDEPEVLSDKWIAEHVDYADVRGGTQAFIHAEDLQNLLVPEKEEQDVETVADVITDFYKSSERLKKALGTEVEELEE